MATRFPIRWTSVFADVPADMVERESAYWCAVTQAAPGRPTGGRGEFVPLVPPAGDRLLWLQAVDRKVGGWHLDVHVPDPGLAAQAATTAGARVTAEQPDLVVLESPLGLPFCLAAESASSRRRPAPAAWPDGHRSLVDQLCLDIPASGFDDECAFWSELTGWPRLPGDLPDFDRLDVPRELAVRILLQRLGEDDSGGIRAHLDLSADDRNAEVNRHVGLGGRVAAVAEHWTTLHDPAGLVYCVTDRTPAVPV